MNVAGFIAENARSGDTPLVPLGQIGQGRTLVLDVREPSECAGGMLAEAVNIPLHELRRRMGELPRDRPVDVYCAVGQRGHYAVRLLRQHGFDARNLSGGWQTYCTL